MNEQFLGAESTDAYALFSLVTKAVTIVVISKCLFYDCIPALANPSAFFVKEVINKRRLD